MQSAHVSQNWIRSNESALQEGGSSGSHLMEGGVWEVEGAVGGVMENEENDDFSYMNWNDFH